MSIAEIEILEAAWRVLNRQPSAVARNAAEAIVSFLDELDDDGTIDRLNVQRSGKEIIAGLLALLARMKS